MKEANRNTYRAKLLKHLAENPQCSRNDLNKAIFPRGMKWLYRNDREWLESVLPPVRTITSLIDWDQRDRELSLRVPGAKEQLLRDEGRFTRRVTAHRIIRALGYSINLPDPKRLPRTVSMINEAVETPQECALRRLRRILAVSDHPQWCFRELIKMCRIRRAWLEDKALICELATALHAGFFKDVPSDILEILPLYGMGEEKAA